jgi:hypothetical protein
MAHIDPSSGQRVPDDHDPIPSVPDAGSVGAQTSPALPPILPQPVLQPPAAQAKLNDPSQVLPGAPTEPETPGMVVPPAPSMQLTPPAPLDLPPGRDGRPPPVVVPLLRRRPPQSRSPVRPSRRAAILAADDRSVRSGEAPARAEHTPYRRSGKQREARRRTVGQARGVVLTSAVCRSSRGISPGSSRARSMRSSAYTGGGCSRRRSRR